MRRARWLLVGGLVFLAASAAFGRSPQNSGKPAAQAKTASTPAKSSDYAGSETCNSCHEEIYNGWEKSPHWRTTLNTKEGPAHQGCEGCHGPAASHVADPSDTSKLFIFQKASSNDINERCLTCHLKSTTEQEHAVNSMHAKNGVSCTSCHSPHHAQAEHLLAKAQPQLCYTCHLAQKPQFDMPFHHRVNEGLVQCTDCHNPHGTERAHQLRTSATQDVVCFKCHTDKQGPFVFEHEAVKIEGCQACHTPHGGPNPHMLKVANVNMLCLQCHTQSSFSGAPGTPSFHNQNTFFQACILCHGQIHGSNFSQFFFQ